ncbi:MAG: DUF4350 domain-containing protein [Bacteroidetes bacterium]|nr:MAG: DUF4350 domain-containing protein [Bacteroidota bacterium]
MHLTQKTMPKIILLLTCLFVASTVNSQQVADTSYNPVIHDPAYSSGNGPVVFIDEGHNNFHTKDGRYLAFAKLLERDGYLVKSYSGTLKKKHLKKGKILVISNALNEVNIRNWVLPNPSAFTEKEIAAVENWVSKGGSLFLIADHMPMAGAAEDMAQAFGFEFTNGFVFHDSIRGPAIFNMETGSLSENIITRGSNEKEAVKQVASFTGQVFKCPVDADPILTFKGDYVNMLPDTAWVFNADTKQISADGWTQGAYKKHGKGRIVVFGEAAMFSAQLAGPQKFRAGMNSDAAPENYQLLLNIIHWLDGKLEDD